MRILLADDQSTVRSALRLLFEQEPEVCVIAEAVDAAQMLCQARRSRPDLVLLDWELPGSPADGLIPELRALLPDVCIIALSGHPEAEKLAMAAGVDRFVSKGEPPEELLRAVCLCFHPHGDGTRFAADEASADASSEATTD
jgi:two-component system response regulator DesR